MSIEAQIPHRELKTWPTLFEDAFAGRKTFEVRERGSRPFLFGERLRLREYNPATEQYSGRELIALVTYSCPLDFMGLRGFDAMSIRIEERIA